MRNWNEPPAADRPPRVLIFDPWCLVPYYTIALARGLIQSGVWVRVVSIGYDLDPGCFGRAGLRNDPGLFDLVSRRRIGLPALRRFLKLLQGAFNLLGLAARLPFLRPGVIHVQQLRLVHAGLPLEKWFLGFARLLGCRLVYTVHNLLPHDTLDRHKERYRRLYRSMDGLICHSGDARERLVDCFGVDPAKVGVIPHGPLFQELAADDGDGAGNAECIVLWQGFVRPYKGLEFLLEAWKELQPMAGVRLVIAGSGEPEYLDALRARAAELGIASSVEFRFRFLEISEMRSLYRSAAIVVYPYREVTTSGALLTGIGNGKAIVATDLPPFRELLRDGENALLVPYGDRTALARALRTLIEDPALRRRLSARAAELRDELGWLGIARETRAFYECILTRTRSGKRDATDNRSNVEMYAQQRTGLRDRGDL